jgi:hypothetical protein
MKDNAEVEYEAYATTEPEVTVLNEWEMMEEEGAPADDMPPLPPQLEKRRANVTYSGRTWTIAKLLEIHQKVELPTLAKKNQNKQFIFDSILQSGKVERVSDDEFVYEWEELPDHLRKGPKWKVLVGTEVMLPEGFNACGAQEGFFAPTNQEQAIGQTKFSYLVDTPIKRPQFAAKPKSSKSTSSKGRPSFQGCSSQRKGWPLAICHEQVQRQKLRHNQAQELL